MSRAPAAPTTRPTTAAGRGGSHTDERLFFPGGGVFFWWQAGVVKALQQQYGLGRRNVSMSGASAGSISCVMAICNVNMDHAMEVALALADEGRVFEGGCYSLMGVWGGMIERWLLAVLPEDCHVTCSGKVNISVTSLTLALTPLHRHVVNTFHSKADLIDACITSVYIPYFIDGHFSHSFRGTHCVDGSLLFFLHNTAWCASEALGEDPGAYVFNQQDDTALMQHGWGFLQTLDKEAFATMFSLGFEYGTTWVHKQQQHQQQHQPRHTTRVHSI
jgi:hypothetical protein